VARVVAREVASVIAHVTAPATALSLDQTDLSTVFARDCELTKKITKR
jgi:hypothetical protein